MIFSGFVVGVSGVGGVVTFGQSVIGGSADMTFSVFVIGISGGVMGFGKTVLRCFGRFRSVIGVNLRVLNGFVSNIHSISVNSGLRRSIMCSSCI